MTSPAMTPREKEIILEAAGRSGDPVAHAKKLVEAEAFLRGERPPFVVWPKEAGTWQGMQRDALSYAEKAAWHEAQAAIARESAISLAAFMRPGEGGAQIPPSQSDDQPTGAPVLTAHQSDEGCAARSGGQTESPDAPGRERS